MNSENTSNHSSTKIFGKFHFQLLLGRKIDICERADLFLVFSCFGAENWTSADMIIHDPLKEQNSAEFIFTSKNARAEAVKEQIAHRVTAPHFNKAKKLH